MSVSPVDSEYLRVSVAGGSRADAGAAPAAAGRQAAAAAGGRAGRATRARRPARARPTHAAPRPALGVAYASTQVNLNLRRLSVLVQ